MITTFAVENYRSLRRLIMPLGRLNVIAGANGTGKSSLYRALRLLADSSRNGAVAALARQGGLSSTLWAGPETISRDVRDGRHPVQGTARSKPVRLLLGFASDDLGYCVDFGLPSPTSSMFNLDPEIKRESVWSGPVLRPSTLLTERIGTGLRVRDQEGDWQTSMNVIRPYDSMLSEFADPDRTPDLLMLREQMRGWRFYDHVRTDADAPARAAHVGTRAPVLSHDGSDLASALQTIREIGDSDALHEAVDVAFPGSRIDVVESGGRFELQLQQHGLLRPLGTAELSDGTLRYLLWVAALLTPRPPELLVLNEPETSLHPELLSPLARLIRQASEKIQMVVVTHARALADELADTAYTFELTKEFGQTALANDGDVDQPAWVWPKR